MKKIFAALLMAIAATSVVPANAGPIGGYCDTPVAVNCTYIGADGRPHNCYYWVAGTCQRQAG